MTWRGFDESDTVLLLIIIVICISAMVSEHTSL